MPSTFVVKKMQPPKPISNNQSGFTMIELLVAISVFAMLSVTGWQVFEGLTRTKNSTNVHTTALSELQYAYLQVQNDVNQITAWQTKQNAVEQEGGNNNNKNELSEAVAYKVPSFFELSSSQLSFIRYADPDPRYQTSPTLMKVDYVMNGDKLIRKQYFTLNAEPSNTSLDSVLITGVTNLTFEALNPEPLSEYSSTESSDNQQNNTNPTKENTNTLLPKGLSVTFNYRDEPIEWIFALPTESPEINSHYQVIEDEKKDEESGEQEDGTKSEEEGVESGEDKDKTDGKKAAEPEDADFL